jgi:drug/metabolite transporter (DMT)-like permease
MRVLVISLIAAFSGAAGQILMRRGMIEVGPLESYAPLAVLEFLWRSLCNPWVVGGTVLSAVLYFCLLTALSWTDVTVAFPMTAIEYVIGAILAMYFLNERVPSMRWAGIALVVVGVVLISLSTSGDAENKRIAEPGGPPSPALGK